MKVASLFSGCGGLDLGFIQAGFEVVWANDFFKEAVETYRHNIGDHIVYGDITKIPSNEIPDSGILYLPLNPTLLFIVETLSYWDGENFLLEIFALPPNCNGPIFIGYGSCSSGKYSLTIF